MSHQDNDQLIDQHYQKLPRSSNSQFSEVALKRQPDVKVFEVLDNFLKYHDPEQIKYVFQQALEKVAWSELQEDKNNDTIHHIFQDSVNAVSALLDYLYTQKNNSIHDMKILCFRDIEQPDQEFFRNTEDVISIEGVQIDKGHLWTKSDEKFVLVDSDEYISCSLNNKNILKADA